MQLEPTLEELEEIGRQVYCPELCAFKRNLAAFRADPCPATALVVFQEHIASGTELEVNIGAEVRGPLVERMSELMQMEEGAPLEDQLRMFDVVEREVDAQIMTNLMPLWNNKKAGGAVDGDTHKKRKVLSLQRDDGLRPGDMPASEWRAIVNRRGRRPLVTQLSSRITRFIKARQVKSGGPSVHAQVEALASGRSPRAHLDATSQALLRLWESVKRLQGLLAELQDDSAAELWLRILTQHLDPAGEDAVPYVGSAQTDFEYIFRYGGLSCTAGHGIVQAFLQQIDNALEPALRGAQPSPKRPKLRPVEPSSTLDDAPARRALVRDTSYIVSD